MLNLPHNRVRITPTSIANTTVAEIVLWRSLREDSDFNPLCLEREAARPRSPPGLCRPMALITRHTRCCFRPPLRRAQSGHTLHTCQLHRKKRRKLLPFFSGEVHVPPTAPVCPLLSAPLPAESLAVGGRGRSSWKWFPLMECRRRTGSPGSSLPNTCTDPPHS